MLSIRCHLSCHVQIKLRASVSYVVSKPWTVCISPSNFGDGMRTGTYLHRKWVSCHEQGPNIKRVNPPYVTEWVMNTNWTLNGWSAQITNVYWTQQTSFGGWQQDIKRTFKEHKTNIDEHQRIQSVSCTCTYGQSGLVWQGYNIYMLKIQEISCPWTSMTF